MSTPADDRPPAGSEEAPAPAISTAPATDPGHRWWSAIPHHLGRARTSTVALSALFVATFALYSQVKPDAPEAPPSVQQPAAPTTAPAPTTQAPTTEPEPTEDEPTTTEPPSSTTPRTTAPPTTQAPEETEEPAPPTTSEPTDGTGTTATTTP